MYYIYDIETKKVIAEIQTDDFSEIEFEYDWEIYGATQSPAFGYEDGLII